MDSVRTASDEKIEVINAKLNDGSDIPDSVRLQLLSNIDSLQSILTENEEKFQEHQSHYQVVLASLKDRLSDIENLEDKLNVSETKRAEAQRLFRRRMLTTFLITVACALAAGLLLYFVRQLRRQHRKLVVTNTEVKRINENLEELVRQRTKSLENANQEMDIFLYRASHDLRRPISSILGLSNIAKFAVTPRDLSSLRELQRLHMKWIG